MRIKRQVNHLRPLALLHEFVPALDHSRENVMRDISVNIGETEVATGVSVSQSFVVDTK